MPIIMLDYQRVANALNLSLPTVIKVSAAMKGNVRLNSPTKNRRRKKTVTDTSLLNVSAIRNEIYDMYKNRKYQ
ncbi:unnamed protein product [Acanthoscelides obtectus]|uniref:Uncharacterized protein n=1 Tax=Acanthoscelides obtectus TaxID=200917 RepID=A0A9P0K902_ACAOB|nr:unnamed protein product [Acanthoscelides obtectus]CAK1632377.1 hypothetical protein AOBTE_LOCUS7517 [Acanthoscelides obtectus]